MQPRHLRNVVVWVGVIAVAAGMWFFVGRRRLHLIDPPTFLIFVAIATAALTALLWWEMSRRDPSDDSDRR
jgi:hypothetical protein